MATSISREPGRMLRDRRVESNCHDRSTLVHLAVPEVASMLRNIAIVVFGLAIAVAVLLMLRPRDRVEAATQDPSGTPGQTAAPGKARIAATNTNGCPSCSLPPAPSPVSTTPDMP